jgi:hypothetical protein
MDKSWMTKWRGSREYMEGAEAFVKYAVTNSRNKNSIVCPCKKCGLNRSLRPEEVYDHLTGGRGILPNYTEWIWHGEKIRAPVPNRVPIVESLNPAPTADNVPIPDEMAQDPRPPSPSALIEEPLVDDVHTSSDTASTEFVEFLRDLDTPILPHKDNRAQGSNIGVLLDSRQVRTIGIYVYYT